jgi:hypothetical protein
MMTAAIMTNPVKTSNGVTVMIAHRACCRASSAGRVGVWGGSLDDLVGAGELYGRYIEAECPRCLHIDHQLELGGLLDRKIAGRLGALQNFLDKGPCTAKHGGIVWSIGHQRTIYSHLPTITDHWQAVL